MVLLHGLGESSRSHWLRSGWVEEMKDSNQLVLIDQRGHGLSDKPRGRRDYTLGLMAGDVIAVLDSLKIEAAAIMGYSLGAMVTMELLLSHAGRFSAAVIGGMGASFPRRGDWRRGCRDEETEPPPPRDRRSLGSRMPGLFERFRYLRPRSQWAARRGLFRWGVPPVDASRLGEINVPVLIVCGTRDALCPGTRELSAKVAGAKRVVLSGRGHLTAVWDPRFKAAVREFLGGLG